jgi:N-acetylglucosaminyldiphosphoundecaprenol N-acetyl-beta-D-mannosaminyltransferase
VPIGRLAVDCVESPEQAIEIIAGFVASGERRLVMTPNLDHLVLAKRNAAFGAAYRRAHLVLADGMPIVLLCRLLRLPVPVRISGSDLITPLAARLAADDVSVFLLGSSDEVSERSAELLMAGAPGLRIVGRATPMYTPDAPSAEMDAAVAAIAASGARFIVVAFGSPKEGQFVDAHIDQLPPATYACIGASLDFVAGKVKRAPEWMRNAGMEWLYRLIQEPGRMWKRYLVRDMAALPMLLGVVVRRIRGKAMITEEWAAVG